MEFHIECQDVWKVFGEDEQKALSAIRSGTLDKDASRRDLNHIVGVAGVSLQIRRGELFCIMGLSGSGKSTLLRHINRLIEPTDGRILVDGEDTALMGSEALSKLRSKKIGMVFQHMALWPHRNLRDNVSYGLEIQGVERSKRWKIADEMLSLVKLDGWSEHYPDELSGGMQQRVGIARALASDPSIMLMDEPFSALDPLIRRDLQTQFLDLSRKLNKTTLFVTHDLEEAVRLGDRIAIMKDGKIVQVGTREDIILRPADDYVAEFVRPISRSHVLTAGAIMRPATGADAQTYGPDQCVDHGVLVDTVVSRLATTKAPVGVMREGALAGVIEPYQLLDAIKTN